MRVKIAAECPAVRRAIRASIERKVSPSRNRSPINRDEEKQAGGKRNSRHV